MTIVADDQALLRGAFRTLLHSADDIAVVGEVGDGRETVALIPKLRPDVVITDIRMPGTDGLAATAEICADPDLRATRVMILTTYETDKYIAQALRAGASGFIGKGIEAQGLLDAVRTIANGDTLLSRWRPAPWWPASSPHRSTPHHAIPNSSPHSRRSNARWSLSSRPACPMWRSPIGCTSAPSPFAPTCSAPCPNWTRASARNARPISYLAWTWNPWAAARARCSLRVTNLAVTPHEWARFHSGGDGTLDLVVGVTGYFYEN